MATLTPPQVYALGRKHGGSPAWSLALVGVVFTESGGVTDRVQPNGQGRGLVQIDLGQHPNITQAQAFDPEFAVQWALDNSSGDPSKMTAPLFYGPRDHPDAANAAKRAALESNPEAVDTAAADKRPAWQKIGDGIGHVVDAVVPGSPVETAKDLAGFAVTVGKAGLWIAHPHNWLRVVEVLVGAALILAGMWHLSPQTAAMVKSTASKAAMAVAVA